MAVSSISRRGAALIGSLGPERTVADWLLWPLLWGRFDGNSRYLEIIRP